VYLQIVLRSKGPDEVCLVLDARSRALLLEMLGVLDVTSGPCSVRLRARVGEPSQTPAELVSLKTTPHQPGDCKSPNPKSVCAACAAYRRKLKEEETNG